MAAASSSAESARWWPFIYIADDRKQCVLVLRKERDSQGAEGATSWAHPPGESGKSWLFRGRPPWSWQLFEAGIVLMESHFIHMEGDENSHVEVRDGDIEVSFRYHSEIVLSGSDQLSLTLIETDRTPGTENIYQLHELEFSLQEMGRGKRQPSPCRTHNAVSMFAAPAKKDQAAVSQKQTPPPQPEAVPPSQQQPLADVASKLPQETEHSGVASQNLCGTWAALEENQPTTLAKQGCACSFLIKAGEPCSKQQLPRRKQRRQQPVARDSNQLCGRRSEGAPLEPPPPPPPPAEAAEPERFRWEAITESIVVVVRDLTAPGRDRPVAVIGSEVQDLNLTFKELVGRVVTSESAAALHHPQRQRQKGRGGLLDMGSTLRQFLLEETAYHWWDGDIRSCRLACPGVDRSRGVALSERQRQDVLQHVAKYGMMAVVFNLICPKKLYTHHCRSCNRHGEEACRSGRVQLADNIRTHDARVQRWMEATGAACKAENEPYTCPFNGPSKTCSGTACAFHHEPGEHVATEESAWLTGRWIADRHWNSDKKFFEAKCKGYLMHAPKSSAAKKTDEVLDITPWSMLRLQTQPG